MSKKIPNKGGSSSQIKSTIKSIEENILDIIHEISKKQYSYDFRIPVDVKALGLSDYYDIVTKPMDLSTLKNNFLDGEYKTVQDVWDAFDLIVTNCKAYNRLPEHPINAKADQMKARVDKAFQKLIEDFVAIDVNIKEYQLQVDHSELKAKEEKKRKVKLDGLDEKNILMCTDKRQQIAPGSLNEKKLFDLQNPENQIQMMPQQRQASIMSQSQSMQEENLFQPNQLKNVGASMLQIPQKMEIENSQGNQSIKAKKIEREKELEAKKQRKLFLLGKHKQFKESLQNAIYVRSQLSHSYSEFLRKEAKVLSDSNEEIKRIPGDSTKRKDQVDFDDIVIRKKGNGFDDGTSETARSLFATPMKQDGADSVISKNFESDEEEEFKPKELLVIKQTAQKTASTTKSDQNGQQQEKRQFTPDKPKKTEGGRYSGQNSVSKSQISGGQTNGESHKKKEDLNHHKVKLLPAAPELKKNQSQMAAQIIQMGQDKKNRELEELKKSEEQKQLEEKRKRERMLKKKEQRLLQDYQNKNNLKEEAQINIQNNSNNLIKIPINNNEKVSNLKPNSNSSNGVNLNHKMASSAAPPAALASNDFNTIRILNTAGINSQQTPSNLQQIQSGAIPQSTSSAEQAPNVSQNVVLIPQISIGGERLDFKFSFDRKSLKARYDSMIIRKQEKYKKILNTNLEKMQQVTSWMICEWEKLKKGIKSETLDYFKDILNERVKIKENLDIRKIQLLLKMFLYRLRDFYKDLKDDQIEKLKIFSEKMYKIASRAIVYKTPLPYRDNPLNAGFDIQVSNTVILEENHPLKKLQEEILEIEREMKYFRRMLQRDIQKYQESFDQQSTDQGSHMNKIGTKKKPKEEGGQFNEAGEGEITGYSQIHNNNASQAFDDSREMGALANADKDIQQQQSELLQFFIDQNKVFESKISDLSRIRMFLQSEQSNAQNEQREKGKLEHDICETYMEDSDHNQVELIDYIKKKRKLNKKANNNKSSSGKWKEEDNEEGVQNLLKKEESSFRLEEDEDYDKEEENTTGGQGDQMNKNDNVLEEDKMENFEFELNIPGMLQNDKYNQQQAEECKILMESSDEEEFTEQENQKYLAYQQVITAKNNKQIQFHQCSNEENESQMRQSSFEFPKQTLKCLNAIQTHQLDQFYEQIPFNPLHFHPEYEIIEADQFEIIRVQLVISDSAQKENLPALIHHLTQKMPRISQSSLIRQFNLQGIVQFFVKLKAKVQKSSEIGRNSDANVVSSKVIPRNHNQVHCSPIKVNLKNTLTKISEAYMADSVSINQILLGDCFFNQSDYSQLCPEDVESVILGLPPRTSFRDFQTNSSNRGSTEYATSQYYHNSSGCNLSSKMEIPDKRKEDRIQTLAAEINIVIPFVSITELELSINSYEIFNPTLIRQMQRR